MEHIKASYLRQVWDKNNWLYEEQHGFRPAYSCESQVITKHFLLFHNDANNYQITGILKQLKFRQLLRHVSVHAGTIIREPFLCLAKTSYSCISSLFMTWSMSWPPTNLLCGCEVHGGEGNSLLHHDIDHAINDEDIEP
jgi:hypothetical protein